jgi:Flotillin
MEKIDSIRIMQVDGLQAGGNGGTPVDSGGGGGNLAEQAVGAALRYRAYAPVLDKLLQEVGLADHGIAGLVAASQAAGSPPAASPPAASQPAASQPAGSQPAWSVKMSDKPDTPAKPPAR